MQTQLRRNVCVQCICRVKARSMEIRRKYLQDAEHPSGLWLDTRDSWFLLSRRPVEPSTTYTAKGTTGKKKAFYNESCIHCCLLGPATWTIFRVLKSGSHLEAKQVVQD